MPSEPPMSLGSFRPIFGRHHDLGYLFGRIQHPGVTLISARPQQGKSALLKALTNCVKREAGHSERFIVGYFEGRGDVDDLLLRSVQSLYHNWLSKSSWLEQAKTVVRQQAGHWTQWLSKSGQLLAAWFKTADPTEITTGAIQ